MATEQIQTNQIAGYAGGGGQVQTKHITTSGGTSDQTTTAFSFVVGPVLIEVTGASNDSTDVYATLWVNMRSFSGSKTSNVTNRIARGVSGSGQCHCVVDRTTSGTVLVVSRIDEGGDYASDGTSIGSINAKNWPNPGRLRITAWEDTQS
jgi:hypothetical protein